MPASSPPVPPNQLSAMESKDRKGTQQRGEAGEGADGLSQAKNRIEAALPSSECLGQCVYMGWDPTGHHAIESTWVRTEAARGLRARATRQKPEADAERREAREISAVPPRPTGLTMAQEPRLATSAPPGSQALLDTWLQNLYGFGECRASEPTWRANLRTPGLAGLSFQAKDSCSWSTPRPLQPGSDNGSCTLPSPTTGV
uniref:Uncharacterized protein n=1 Tax=Rangifer tarandus platyrhynchus TaxID=3082113 RepID=A0ACB0F567_RANTA|nr:unnamed protein product [Rangifer tarandus platyrhynchus]